MNYLSKSDEQLVKDFQAMRGMGAFIVEAKTVDAICAALQTPAVSEDTPFEYHLKMAIKQLDELACVASSMNKPRSDNDYGRAAQKIEIVLKALSGAEDEPAK